MPFNSCDVFRCDGRRDSVEQIEADNTVSLMVGADHEIAMDFGPLLKDAKEIESVLNVEEWNTETPVSRAPTRIVDNDRTDHPNSMVAWNVGGAVFGQDPRVRITIQNNQGGIRALNGTICVHS